MAWVFLIASGIFEAVWATALGASLAVIDAMLTASEPASIIKIVLLPGLLGCIAGLKLVS